MKRLSFSLFLSLMLVLLTVLPARSYLWEGFEKENFWAVSVMDNNAVNFIRTVTNNRTEGKYSLEVDLDKTGSESKGFVSREGSMDLSKITEIQFDIFIESPIKVSLGISTGPGFIWFESESLVLKKGWNRKMKVSMVKKVWSTADTGWQPTALPKNLIDTKKIVFVFTQGRTGKVFLDNIQFNGAKVPNDALTMPFDPVDRTKMEDELGMLETLA
ncbi:MAG: hypothetical protein PHF84_06485, partial [bacterium]|nr:hypothetical protein [bacterium]